MSDHKESDANGKKEFDSNVQNLGNCAHDIKPIFENRLMNYSEAATYLRYSEVYLRRLVKDGKIPYIKRGRSIRFRVASLDQWNKESEVSFGPGKAKR
jgi:excisionase family DNA binding protein